jgi:hypothetical protein
MELTLGEICSLATGFVQGRTDLSLSEVSRWANLAHQEVATRIRYSVDEEIAYSSTTSGENRITVPPDFGYPIRVSNLSVGNSTLTLKEADTFDSEATTPGVPLYYALYRDWMELWPSPDSSYSLQIRYGRKLPTMVASSSTPALDERYHLPIVFRTAALVAASKDDLDREATNQARYISAMGSTPSDQALRQRDKQSMTITVRRHG